MRGLERLHSLKGKNNPRMTRDILAFVALRKRQSLLRVTLVESRISLLVRDHSGGSGRVVWSILTVAPGFFRTRDWCSLHRGKHGRFFEGCRPHRRESRTLKVAQKGNLDFFEELFSSAWGRNFSVWINVAN